MISGVISMMNSETFIYGMETVHNALYKLQRPNGDDEYQVIKRLIEGFIMMLSDFDFQRYQIITNFLLTHNDYNEDEVYLLYTYLIDYKENTTKN